MTSLSAAVTATDKPSIKATGALSSTVSSQTTTVVTKEQSQQRSHFNLETHTLVWLDRDVNSTEDNLITQKKLRQAVNQIRVFDNTDECLNFLTDLKDQKIALIVSGSYGRRIVPLVHDFRYLTSVYVYCINKSANEQWAKGYPKVKGVFTTSDELVDELSKAQRIQQLIDGDSVGISIYSSSTAAGALEERNTAFLYFQLLVELLLNMSINAVSRQQLLDICIQQYEGNDYELQIIKEIENTYYPQKAIWWYTRETCLYRILNKGLRDNNFEVIFAMRSFIKDLTIQLYKEHEQYLRNYTGEQILHVYRGQAILNEELNLLRQNVGEFISMNAFLSTSSKKATAVQFVNRVSTTPELSRILYQFNIDTRFPNTKPYADIKHLSYFGNEDEVLIALGSIFKIQQIEYNQHEQMWIATLSLCSQDDYEMKDILSQIKTETDFGLASPGTWLYRQGEYEKSKNYFEQLMNQFKTYIDDISLGVIYNGLALAEVKLQKFDEALLHFENEFEIWEKVNIDVSNQLMASCYQNIADLYFNTSKFELALEYTDKALEVFSEGSKARGDVYLIKGNIYSAIKEFNLSLDFYQKAFAIFKIHLPENYDTFGFLYNNMSAVYVALKNYSKAFEYSNKSLSVLRKSLHANHPTLQAVEENIRRMKERMEKA
ncbi:unnamed protein product [Didymodactylos carnosus]|uniref:NAD(P)(+)--arginine ADP-ribosyltransferase n=1 Tax=Didymodactylos carnosus TaxID=1234261 RepID=A0A814ZA27_9BILA|nr:unnamed protein product [Didymodactylos carnosus]CAF1241340.1 unnamed protein product [Didymodactylos carnosus]CAF3604966.1 unnamed protein product [Didymodactylos carnosus]CAF4004509.1 unnamed protein product [Didymodactylos carnosus]